MLLYLIVLSIKSLFFSVNCLYIVGTICTLFYFDRLLETSHETKPYTCNVLLTYYNYLG